VRHATPARLCLALALLAAGCATNGADERAALERENARLRAEVEALRAELAGRPVADGAAGAGAEAGAAPRLEPVFVPRSRVSLEVSRDAASGRTAIASLWYRTADIRPLPRTEWMQVRAEQTPDGRLDGAWLTIERHGGRGSAQVAAGRLSVDGRAFELPSAGYETGADALRPGRAPSGQRQERATFVLPPEALAAAATAISARLEAGAVSFDLTDEHLAAFAAVAARLGQGAAASGD
jgi:hypothetical protein